MLIGCDIGGTKCAVVLGDENGNILKKQRFATQGAAETVERLCREAKTLAQNAHVTACGVSCGGPLDEKAGVILSPPNLPGWDRIPIRQKLEEALGVPCAVRNDANACALAEWRFGAGKGTENMVFMTFGTGLGAGIIAGGRLLSGANGFAGELGHIRLAGFGPSGYGKCGSFEGFCSGGGITELAGMLAKEARQRGREPAWAQGEISAATVAEAARAGDETAKNVFTLSGQMLGRGLAIVIDLLNPEKILIGSVFARCRDLLEGPMYEILRKEALPQALAVCEIGVPALGEAIGDAAALAVAQEAGGKE